MAVGESVFSDKSQLKQIDDGLERDGMTTSDLLSRIIFIYLKPRFRLLRRLRPLAPPVSPAPRARVHQVSRKPVPSPPRRCRSVELWFVFDAWVESASAGSISPEKASRLAILATSPGDSNQALALLYRRSGPALNTPALGTRVASSRANVAL